MAVKRITVCRCEIEDTPGSLQKLLTQAASNNVDFQCFAAFSTGTGKGQLFACAKDPQTLESCAQAAGIQITAAAGFIITNPDRVGVAADDLKPLADAGINGIAGTAIVCDGNYHLLIIVDAADGDAAADALGAA